MLLIVDGGQFVRFVVNVICEDFVWFILKEKNSSSGLENLDYGRKDPQR
jgi:hypothetical protein